MSVLPQYGDSLHPAYTALPPEVCTESIRMLEMSTEHVSIMTTLSFVLIQLLPISIYCEVHPHAARVQIGTR